MPTPTSVRRLFRRRPAYAARQHLWAAGGASTVEGISARLAVEFTLEVDDPASCPADPDLAAIDAVENAVRHHVLETPVAELPTSGDAVSWVPADLVAGARITDVFVAASEVEVTQELRRLVARDPTAATDRWT